MKGGIIFFTLLFVLCNSNAIVGQPLIIDSILIYGQVSTSRLESIQDYWQMKDSLAALGNYPKAIRLHGRLFDECFQVNEDISIVKGVILVGEVFYSSGKNDVLSIHPISKNIVPITKAKKYAPTKSFKKEWENAVSFFHSNRVIIH